MLEMSQKYVLEQVITFYFILFLFYGTTNVTVFKGPKCRLLCSRYKKLFKNGISKIFWKKTVQTDHIISKFQMYKNFLQQLLLGPFMNTLLQMISYYDYIWRFIFETCNMLIRSMGNNKIRKFRIYTRSSHQRCSIKKGVLRNFTKFTGKHLCQSLFFNKVAGLRLATLLKKRLWHRCFPVNFVKFLRTPVLQNTSGRLLLLHLFFQSWVQSATVLIQKINCVLPALLKLCSLEKNHYSITVISKTILDIILFIFNIYTTIYNHYYH